MHFLEDITGRDVFKDNDAARIGADNRIIYRELDGVSEMAGNRWAPSRMPKGIYDLGGGDEICMLIVPFEPPIKRNVINERITPNTSVVSSVCTLPVFGSGRNSSRLLPRDTRISCDLEPEKLPCTACVMAVECCSVKLYRYMAAPDLIN